MQVKFNPTGTHIKEDLLKIRLDLYPDLDDRTYSTHYLRVPVIPGSGYTGEVDETGSPVDREDFDSWLAGLPHIWQLNPCLCVFIVVDENITGGLLTEFFNDVYKADVLATIDDIMSRPSAPGQPHLAAHLISPYLRNKTRLSTAKTNTFDEQVKTYISQILAGFQIRGSSGGNAEYVEPQSIDVGPGATNRGGDVILDNATLIDLNNPANATGTIDTYEIWTIDNFSAVTGGFQTDKGSNVYQVTDSELLGSVTGGAKQTFTGLTISVILGDYISAYAVNEAGYLSVEADSGTSAVVTKSGEYIDPGDSATYGAVSNRSALSLYAAGTEGGATDKTAGDNGAGADSRLSFLAGLARADSGSGSDGAFGRGLVTSDSGLGVDVGVIPGQKNITNSEEAIGDDALKALVGTSGVGSDMKLPGRQGHVTIPSKGVSL